MSTFPQNKPSYEAESEITTYQAIRDAGRSWFPKVMDQPAIAAADLTKAAQQVGLPVKNRTIIFEDQELEGAMLMDFFLFDYRPTGKTPAEACVFAEGELDPLEAEFHRAGATGHLSFFEIDSVHEQLPRIRLCDLLEPNRPHLWLTDINLSASFRQLGPALLFTRVLSMGTSTSPEAFRSPSKSAGKPPCSTVISEPCGPFPAPSKPSAAHPTSTPNICATACPKPSARRADY